MDAKIKKNTYNDRLLWVFLLTIAFWNDETCMGKYYADKEIEKFTNLAVVYIMWKWGNNNGNQ